MTATLNCPMSCRLHTMGDDEIRKMISSNIDPEKPHKGSWVELPYHAMIPGHIPMVMKALKEEFKDFATVSYKAVPRTNGASTFCLEFNNQSGVNAFKTVMYTEKNYWKHSTEWGNLVYLTADSVKRLLPNCKAFTQFRSCRNAHETVKFQEFVSKYEQCSNANGKFLSV
jgi:hypothetical protein